MSGLESPGVIRRSRGTKEKSIAARDCVLALSLTTSFVLSSQTRQACKHVEMMYFDGQLHVPMYRVRYDLIGSNEDLADNCSSEINDPSASSQAQT